MAVIGGTQIFEVLLPRVSTLGLMGILFNSVTLAPASKVALPTLGLYIVGVSVPISLIVNSSLKGEDYELWYFLVPSVASFAVLVVAVAFELLVSNDANQPWLGNLGLRLKAVTKWQQICAQCTPPYWQQVVHILQGSYNAQYAQCTQRIMDLGNTVEPDATLHPDDAAVLNLDPPLEDAKNEQESQEVAAQAATFPNKCTFYVDKSTISTAVDNSSPGIVDLLACIRRIPNTRIRKNDNDMDGLDAVLDVFDMLG